MKNIIIKIALSAFLSGILNVACQSNILPKLSSPTYQSYNQAGQKGYIVEFNVAKGKLIPTAIVINGIRQNITADHRVGEKFRINVIAESSNIFGFKPQVVEKENGVFYNEGKEEKFHAVNFKLISQK